MSDFPVTPAPTDRKVGVPDPPKDNNQNARAIAAINAFLGDPAALAEGDGLAFDSETGLLAPKAWLDQATADTAFVSKATSPLRLRSFLSDSWSAGDDATQGLQDAIDAGASEERSVDLGWEPFRLSGTVYGKQGVNLLGEGNMEQIVSDITDGSHILAFDPGVDQWVRRGRYSGFGIVGTGSDGDGIFCRGITDYVFSYVGVRDVGGNGCTLHTRTWRGDFFGCDFGNNGKAGMLLTRDNDGVTGANAVRFFGGRLANNDEWGLQVGEAGLTASYVMMGFSLYGTTMEGNGLGAVDASRFRSLNLYEVFSEFSPIFVRVGWRGEAYGMNMRGCQVQLGAFGATDEIGAQVHSDVRDIRLEDNDFWIDGASHKTLKLTAVEPDNLILVNNRGITTSNIETTSGTPTIWEYQGHRIRALHQADERFQLPSVKTVTQEQDSGTEQVSSSSRRTHVRSSERMRRSTVSGTNTIVINLSEDASGLVMVAGEFDDSGTVRRFWDLVYYATDAADAVVVSSREVDSPAARTYATGATQSWLNLSMASDTYTVVARATSLADAGTAL